MTTQNQNLIVSKREFILGLAVCTLAGIVIGMILSPRKDITIGSHYGNHYLANASANPEELPSNYCKEAEG